MLVKLCSGENLTINKARQVGQLLFFYVSLLTSTYFTYIWTQLFLGNYEGCPSEHFFCGWISINIILQPLLKVWSENKWEKNNRKAWNWTCFLKILNTLTKWFLSSSWFPLPWEKYCRRQYLLQILSFESSFHLLFLTDIGLQSILH